ncbi:MAG: hypothetical protein ACKO5V_05295 [Actinomycetota bacterium]
MAFAWFDQRLFFQRLGMPLNSETSVDTLRVAMRAVLVLEVVP